jgi:CO/xanthine dehydrogenase FAD-binding subunit
VPFEMTRPATLADAFADLAGGDALPLAGGTSVVVLMNTRLLEPTRLVSLGRIPGLTRVRAVDGHIELGAMSTHRALARDPILRTELPRVAEMFGRIGNVRVRAWATVGGNLAHADPAQDPAVLLTALGASVTADSARGVRQIPVGELADGPYSTVLADDELITAIRIPRPSLAERHAYVKFLPRTADDYATVSAAVRVEVADDTVTDAAVVMGSVGPTVLLMEEAASALVGRRLGDEGALEQMAQSVRDGVTPMSDHRGSREYRREMAGVIARRAVLACAGDGR